jgi:hypothetical protein
VDQWTFDVVAFPLFVAVTAAAQSAIIGFEVGPRLLRARRRDIAVAHTASSTEG